MVTPWAAFYLVSTIPAARVRVEATRLSAGVASVRVRPQRRYRVAPLFGLALGSVFVAWPQGVWRRRAEWSIDGDAPPGPSRVTTLEWTLVSPLSLLVASMRGLACVG